MGNAPTTKTITWEEFSQAEFKGQIIYLRENGLTYGGIITEFTVSNLVTGSSLRLNAEMAFFRPKADSTWTPLVKPLSRIISRSEIKQIDQDEDGFITLVCSGTETRILRDNDQFLSRLGIPKLPLGQ